MTKQLRYRMITDRRRRSGRLVSNWNDSSLVFLFTVLLLKVKEIFYGHVWTKMTNVLIAFIKSTYFSICANFQKKNDRIEKIPFWNMKQTSLNTSILLIDKRYHRRHQFLYPFYSSLSLSLSLSRPFPLCTSSSMCETIDFDVHWREER